MDQTALKKMAAKEALNLVQEGSVLGVGTGSTVNCFIDALAASGIPLAGAVSSSNETTKRLQARNIPIVDLHDLKTLELYIDGADEVNPQKQLIKGGGGALTREKILAASSRQFVCIVDASKKVDVLGQFPLPVEIIPMARSYVTQELIRLGGKPSLRDQFETDNGNCILDIHQLRISDPATLEQQINNLAGVVTVGLFAHRAADQVIVASPSGIDRW